MFDCYVTNSYFNVQGFSVAKFRLVMLNCSLDIAPDSIYNYTCEQQVLWGKCNETWMKGYCCNCCSDFNTCDPSYFLLMQTTSTILHDLHVSGPQIWYIQIWIIRISYSLAFIITFRIFWKELSKRVQKKVLVANKAIFWFSLLSLATNSIHALNSIFLYLPLYCIIQPRMGAALGGLRMLFINYYQLARLYYCFSSSSTHSKIGYPTSLFYCLYIIGIVILSAFGIVGFSMVNVFTVDNIYQCNTEYHADYELLVIVYALMFWSWDFITLILYLWKIYIFKKKNSNEQINTRIKFILSKITALTILYEALIVIAVVIGVIGASTNWNTWYSMLFNIYEALNGISTSFIILLMLEHNNDYYITFIRKYHYIFCCCSSSIIYVSGESNDEKQISKNIEDTSIDNTANLSEKIEPMGIQNEYEETETATDVS